MWPELRRKFNHSIRFSPRDTLVTLGILLGVSGLCFALQGFDPQNNFVSMLFVLAVFLIARMTEGYFYGIFSSLVSVLIVNYLFTYPYFHFNFTLAGYPIAILTMLVVSITTSALTSRAKQSARAQLESDREKTRSNLLRAVSHDLRTPLTSILGVSSAILENDDAIGKSERLALLQDVQSDASWLIRMVENLLTITRMDNGGEAKVTKTPEVGEEILEASASKFRKLYPDFHLVMTAPEDFMMIPMDALLIEQVLLNLMENAVLHAVSADQLWVSLIRRNDMAVFQVRDNGAGIAPALLPKLFSGSARCAEESTGDQKRNMGIGLSVCDTIIRAHGGTLTAQNLKSGGALFEFSLPLEEEME